MADFLRNNPELRPFVLSNVRYTGIRIGAGAYGSVEEVIVSGTNCAAKRIHDIFQDRSEMPAGDIHKASTQFVKECQLMSSLRHPHIVQFLGVCFFRGSRLPGLVMERLLTNLHDLLDPETDPPPLSDVPKPFFPLSLKCSILHDVASGLSYLHERSPPIVHRDLSARNILLNTGMVAKIADLGVARIIPRMRTAATMTKAPGASVYMPPEAVETNTEEDEGKRSKYDVSIDIFSFGVVSIFILSQTFPCNLLAPNYRKGRQHIARTELERRDKYMRMIYSQLHKSHPLLQMIERSLDFPEDRPSISEVVDLLVQARAEDRDEQVEMNKLELIQFLQSNKRLEHELQSQVAEIQQKLTETEAGLTRAQDIIMSQRLQIEEMAETNRKEKDEFQENLKKMETEKDELLEVKDREITRVREQLRQLRQQRPLLPIRKLNSRPHAPKKLTAFPDVQDVSPSKHTPRDRKLTVECHEKKTAAPCKMERGSATSDSQFAYFMPDYCTSVYRYEWSTEKWDRLPICPHCNSGLVIINSVLTAVGGYDGARSICTNKLVTLRLSRWIEEYPPMNTACSMTAVVITSDSNYVIVMGGYGEDGEWISEVQLFHMRSSQWYQVTKLPQPLSFPSTTISGNHLHVIGRDDDTGYSSSLQDLLSCNQRTALHLTCRNIKWTLLPCPPTKSSTTATLFGQLVIIGGLEDGSEVGFIHQLIGTKWMKIGSMSIARTMCLVVCPSPDKLMIVGGLCGYDALKTVEECTVL